MEQQSAARVRSSGPMTGNCDEQALQTFRDPQLLEWRRDVSRRTTSLSRVGPMLPNSSPERLDYSSTPRSLTFRDNMDILNWFNTAVGAVGLLLAVIGILYSMRAAKEATSAAKHASTLLTRLVVYPFRELDGNYATLTQNETEVLQKIFDVAKLRKSPLTLDQVRQVVLNGTRLSNESLELLVDRGWLTKLPNGFTVNAERIPYLTFLDQVENGDLA